MNKLVASVFILLSVFITMNAQPGNLDPSFGTAGKLSTPLSVNDYGSFYAITQQTDGKILAAGAGFNKFTAFFNIRVIRYTTSGGMDNSFGSNGIATVNVGSGDYERATAITMQPDGKILVAGYTFYFNNLDFFILRLKTDGQRDSTFGLNGISVTDLNGEEYANALSLQKNGKILIAGCASNGTDLDFALLRFNDNGLIDTTFGNKGKVLMPIENGSDDVALSMQLQANGKIVMGGYSYNNTNSTSKISLARFDSTGVPDNSFGTSGKVLSSYNAGGDGLNAIAIQSDGNIVGVGNANRANIDMLVVRYKTTGTLDSTFCNNGVGYFSFGQKGDEGKAVKIQADGKILIAGNTDSVTTDFALLRLTNTGTLDNTFGSNGKVAVDFSATEDIPNAMLLQADGKVVLAGYRLNDCALARFLTTPPTMDAALSNLSVPASKCGAIGNNQSVTVTLTNNSSIPLNSGEVSLNLLVSGANTGSYNASNGTAISNGATATITFTGVNLPNLGINLFTTKLSLVNDIDSTNNKINSSDTAFNTKPTAAFTMSSSGNTYTFIPAVIGKNPITYKWNFGDGSPLSFQQSPSHHYSYVSAYYAKLVVTDACGGTDSISKIVNITVGIPEHTSQNKFSLFPNPAKEEVTVLLHAGATTELLILTDLSGNTIKAVMPESTGKFLLKLYDVSNGMYLIRIGSSVQKLTVAH